MLKVDKNALDRMEINYPGIRDQIYRLEQAAIPACPRCGSENTAEAQVGIVGRSISIATATNKIKLIPNGPKPGKYFCNTCRGLFDQKVIDYP
jgi:predicted nucleic-acid-binding Zn-ribbon protein